MENEKKNAPKLDTELASKIEFLEHRISSLDKSIQKIISYIDEE